MNTIRQTGASRLRLLGLIALMAFFSTACNVLDNDADPAADLTEEDIEIMTDVAAQAVADESEGLMANLNDMTADVDHTTIEYRGRRFRRFPNLRPCRGGIRTYDQTYEPSTGEHTISYNRDLEGPNCSKSVDVLLTYIFTDVDGAFMEFPKDERDRIASIEFAGTRSGQTTFTGGRSGRTRSTTFDRTGAWFMDGVDQPVTTLAGTQESTGSYEMSLPDSVVAAGTYSMTLLAIDVTIERQETEEGDLEQLVTGTIQYSMSITKTRNGETVTREGEGTIELNGSGRGLMRIMGLRELYRIDLQDGTVEEAPEDEATEQ